jgi:hypothetical protein
VGRIRDRYQAILLDMIGTFLFGQDRYGPDQDYHATYRALGGSHLAPDNIRRAVTDCHTRMAAGDEDPTVRSPGSGRAGRVARVRRLPAAELSEAVIARHELSHVPNEYAAALRRLSATHRLAVVTNLWSREPRWLAELSRAGVLDLFAAVVVTPSARAASRPRSCPARRWPPSGCRPPRLWWGQPAV